MGVSILLVVYNSADYLQDCLSSVAAEIQPGDEVIVVDNASKDSSAALVKQNWPQVRLFQNNKNLGFAAACNQGAEYACQDILVFLNLDTRVHTGWLQALLDGLAQREGVGLVTSRLVWMSQPEKIQMCGQDVHYTGLAFGRGAMQPADRFAQSEAVGAVSGASFAIRKELWERLGGFDPLLFMYYEETDLSWRAALQGYSSWYIPESVVEHDAKFKPSPGAVYYSTRNRLILLAKHWKMLTLLLLSPALLLAELVEWVYLLRLGRGYAWGKLRAWGWLLGHIGAILHSRRRAQVGRRVSDAELLERCAVQLSPAVMPLGELAQGLVKIANRLFDWNYRLALAAARWLRL